VTRCLYYEKYCETHKVENIKQTGMFIDAEYPILGALLMDLFHAIVVGKGC
jgi:hypothetical protein